jgi:hypothetical protein
MFTRVGDTDFGFARAEKRIECVAANGVEGASLLTKSGNGACSSIWRWEGETE